MPNEINIFETRNMAEAVKRMPEKPTFLKNLFFSKEKTFETHKIDIDIKKGTRKVAPFISRVIGGKIIPNTGYQTNTYEPPLVAPEKVTTCGDLLARLPGETIYGGSTPEEKAAKKMVEDLTELEDIITRREEVMVSQLVTTGTIIVKGEGVNDSISFGLNKETLSTKKWGTSSADIYGDLDRWRKAVAAKGFVTPDTVVMGAKAAAAFIQDEKILKLFDNNRINVGTIVPKAAIAGASYIGRITALSLDIYSYDAVYLDDWTTPGTETETKFIPENAVVIGCSETNNAMYYAGLDFADPETKKISIVEAKRLADAYVERKPPRRFLTLQSAPLPVATEIDTLFCATVMD